MKDNEKIHIKIAVNKKDYQQLALLASSIWYEHYAPIIGEKQVKYMLDKFQSAIKIESSVINDQTIYYMPFYQEQLSGYCAIRKINEFIFLSKFYVHKNFRGLGIAKKMLTEVKEYANLHQCSSIFLTVNKHNTNSIHIYLHLGFVITDEVVTDIGDNYVMDDYKMTYFI